MRSQLFMRRKLLIQSIGMSKQRLLLLTVTIFAILFAAAAVYFTGGLQNRTALAASVGASSTKAHIQSCQPVVSTIPSALQLATAPVGLTQLIDSPTLYAVYGTTAADLQAQIASCAPSDNSPGAEYTAATRYQLNWLYQYTVANGRCTIGDVRVGLHITQDMPSWQPVGTGSSHLYSKWGKFMANLQTHEAGHTALDKQYAAQLLSDLQNFPPTDCNDLDASVRHLTDTDVAVLNQANDNYDSTTDHGVTQGAVLPR